MSTTSPVSEGLKKLEQELRKRYYGWSGASHFEGTSTRLANMFEEFCWTNEKIRENLECYFKAAYTDQYSEMLVSGPTKVWTLCPHHLLPCAFETYIGYVPNEMVLGLSKFSRVAEVLARRPVIQEMYAREVADSIEKYLKPKGVGVYVMGQHGCIRCRGVHQGDVNITTSVLRGVILDRPEIRSEFLALVLRSNGH